ncbi:DHS-like NAD/FAD-binding domain-containing protein [Mollisia scopiformis]|uniref:protein acetyllysine N-acetyltransferase n=1 Tax=Mollisia scopiformis TaxID=149040 RepID=A0A194X1I0_MOLSC|nr:DHS-like NAD/FAD-binding domain-containing protein [Mollisia scopiformis]KUJ14051.1 DHS-like NAD/FAD-binding domain-containing protein [Mollisia scopiformis]
MADSSPKVAEAERIESPDAIDLKAQTLVDQIKKSKHFIAFTGAGVSTSAGIPDFRGPEGAWTLRAQGRQRTGKTVSTLQAIPTPTHMALVDLQNRGILKYLLSQNCDGLHRKSGITSDRISELHGNSNRESCKDCGKEYIRDFRAVATYEKTVHDHRTGRKCACCGGVLLDSIVNFGDFLPVEVLERARSNAKRADLCLVLGSSLTIPPASGIPEIVGKRKGGKLAICNLQSTPIDGLADVRIFSKADDLMIRIMEKLDIPIPPFILHRRLMVDFTSKDERHQLKVYGVDEDGTPATFLQSVKLEYNRRLLKSEPFVFNFRGAMDLGLKLKLELEFMRHYGEPNLDIVCEAHEGGDEQTLYLLDYDPVTGEWKTSKQRGQANSDGDDAKEVIDLTDDTL